MEAMRLLNISFVVVLLVLAAACGSKSGSGTDAAGTGVDGTGTGGDSWLGGPCTPGEPNCITGDGGSWTCNPVQCAGKTLECNDCIDNDMDGESDAHDRECLGPCDNTEGPGLESGVGGTGGNSCKVDCYFDFGNGPGNDNCLWDHRCDTFEPEAAICSYDSSLVGTNDCPATQDPVCAQVCMPFTPNGCDCFGCCTMPNAGPGGVGSRDVWIGALDENNSNTPTCTFADIADPVKCPTCTPVANCYNACDPCEVCIGAPLPDPSCTGGMQCASGYQPCGLPGQAECAGGSYCVSGCCQAVLL